MPHLILLIVLLLTANFSIEKITNKALELPTILPVTTSITGEYRAVAPQISVDEDRKLLEITRSSTKASSELTVLVDTTRPRITNLVDHAVDLEEEHLPLFVTEVMPRFPGCEEIEGTDAEKKQCADQKLLEYIYTNWKIPDKAQEMQVHETIVISFIIDTKGKVRAVEVIKEPGYGMGESMAKLFRAMNDLPQAWCPGQLHGQAVSIKYTFPVRYKVNY